MYCSIKSRCGRRSRFSLTVLCCSIWSVVLYAQTKSVVGVQFLIESENYLTYYNTEPGLSSALIESAGTDVLVTLINREFPFIEFTRTTMPDRITFVMKGDLDIQLEPMLSLGTGETYSSDALLFRDAVTSITTAPPPNKDAFSQELLVKVSEWLTTKRESLITDLFGNIKVSKSATAIPSSTPPKWVMPFTMEDFQIGARSTLQVVTKVAGDLGDELCDYTTIAQGPVTTSTVGSMFLGKMFCNIDPLTTNSDCLTRIQRARIEGVYMKKYIALTRTQENPAGFNFSN